MTLAPAWDSEGFRISFSWLEYGDKFVTQGVSTKKRFDLVEEEIHKVLGGKLEDYYTIRISPLISDIPKNLGFTKSEKNIHFETNTVNEKNSLAIKDINNVEVVPRNTNFIITEVKKFTVDKTTLEMKLQ